MNSNSKSKRVGKTKGDFLILEKLIKNKRSYYKIKCNICGDISYTYNLGDKYLIHSDVRCRNTTIKNIIGYELNDFVVINANYSNRLMLDVKCKVCGSVRKNIAKKDFVNKNNFHGKICTIKSTDIYPNKKIVRKLIRGYQNCKMRILNSESNEKYSGYKGLKFGFSDTTEFVAELYESFDKLISQGIDINDITIDRIDNSKGYIPGNVRGATSTTQANNKRNSYIYFLNEIEIERKDLLMKLNIYQQKLSRLFNNKDCFIYKNNTVTRELKYK